MDADEKRASGIFICIQRPAGTAPLNNPSLSGAEKFRPLSKTRMNGKSFAAICTVAKIDHGDLCIPTPTRRRLPFQTERIRWRIEMFQIHRQLLIDDFKSARRRGPAMT